MLASLKILLAVALVGVGLPSGAQTRTGGISTGPVAFTGASAAASRGSAWEIYDGVPELAADALLAAKGAPRGTLPKNPAELLPDVPHTLKANVNRVIQPSETLSIRAEQHPLKPGETFSPRHHGQHYHVEMRLDPAKSWNNSSNVVKVKPPNYVPGERTGFLPGEPFPGQ